MKKTVLALSAAAVCVASAAPVLAEEVKWTQKTPRPLSITTRMRIGAKTPAITR